MALKSLQTIVDAIDLGLGGVGDYEKALPEMQRSVKLCENSHTICLSMRELVDPTDAENG